MGERAVREACLDLVLPRREVVADDFQLEFFARRRPELFLPRDEIVLEIRVVVAEA